jgi:hypothetical protein
MRIETHGAVHVIWSLMQKIEVALQILVPYSDVEFHENPFSDYRSFMLKIKRRTELF